MSNSNNLIYFNSGAIRVFPSAYRGFKPTKSAEALDADPVVWNADASLTTEYNLTHMFSHLLGRQSFIISSPEPNNPKPNNKDADFKYADFKCVINGYYFEIDGDAFCEAYKEFYDDWLETLRGERRGCLCIRLLPKFEKGANGETLDPATADFNLTSLVSMDLTQPPEGYLLDNELGEFTGLAFCPNATVISSLSATLNDGSVLYSLPLNDESLYAETVYQEVKEKIIEGVKAVNWSKHLEVAPLSVGSDLAIDLNSYSGTSNLHTFYVGDLKTLCNSGLSGMVNFPSALESTLGTASSSTATDEAATPNLLLALEVFDPGIGSMSSPKTSPVIQILHTFGYSKAKIAVEYTPEKDQTVNEIADWMDTRGIVTVTETDEATKTSTSYYTKTFNSDCCTFIRYGNRDNELKTAWGPWEGLSEEELKLFACVRAVEAEKRLADDLISGNIIPRFAERLKIYAKTESSVSTSLNPGWYYYPQTSISALAFLGGADMLDSTVSWEQKQLLNDLTRYAALLEVIGDDEMATNPRLQRVSIFNSNNEVVASCSRVVSGTSNKWTFDITSANIQEQFVARADKQKVHQIRDYASLTKLIVALCWELSRDSTTIGGSLQAELQFTNKVPLSSLDSNQGFHISPSTVGHLTVRRGASNAGFQLLLELQRVGLGDNGISFSQTLSAELENLINTNSLAWVVRYPTNVQNPIPLGDYKALKSLRDLLKKEMPFGCKGEEAVSSENSLSVPVVISNSFTMEEVDKTFADYEIPRGSIGYLAILADQAIPESPDDYGPAEKWEDPFIAMLSLLTPRGEHVVAHYYIGRISNGAREAIWEISGGHVALADKATVAESIEGAGVQGTVSHAKQADQAKEALRVPGGKVVGAVATAKKAAEATKATKAFSLSLSSAKAAVAEDTDTGFGNSIFGSKVSTSVTAPGLYLVEVVLEHITGIALRDSTFFFIPERSDLPAPETQQTLCNGTVTLTTTYYYYSRPSNGDYDFESATFSAQGRGRIEGGVATDLAIKVWQIAEATGKANGPFQNN